ncbi:hypothetical protein FRX31_009483, partial [Thalictrum thalictroides]
MKDIFKTEELKTMVNTKPVVVVSLGKIRIFQGAQLATTTGTMLYLNPDIPEVIELKN